MLMSDKRNKRLTRENWLQLALNTLESEGVDGLKVERICNLAGKTRGSFYHHFEDHNTFVIALLEYWQADSTARIIKTVAQISNPNEQRIALARQVVDLSTASENAIRGWAGTDERARKVLARVDGARLEFLQKGIDAIAQETDLKLTQREIENLAMLDYGLFIGAQAVKPEGTSEYFLQLNALSQEMLAAWMTARARRKIPD